MTEFFSMDAVCNKYEVCIRRRWNLTFPDIHKSIRIFSNILTFFERSYHRSCGILHGKIECILHPIPLTANMDQVARFCDAKFLSNGALSALFTVCKIFLVKRCQRKQIVQLRQEADVLASVCCYLTHTFNPDLIFWSADQMCLRLVLLLLNVQTYSSHGDLWSMYETPI